MPSSMSPSMSPPSCTHAKDDADERRRALPPFFFAFFFCFFRHFLRFLPLAVAFAGGFADGFASGFAEGFAGTGAGGPSPSMPLDDVATSIGRVLVAMASNCGYKAFVHQLSILDHLVQGMGSPTSSSERILQLAELFMTLTKERTIEVIDALVDLGAPENMEKIGYRFPFAFLGVKGAKPGSAVEIGRASCRERV